MTTPDRERAACLTCGTAIFDPTAGTCHECGAEDKWIGSQWVRPGFPDDVMPFDLLAAPDTAPSELRAALDGLRGAVVAMKRAMPAGYSLTKEWTEFLKRTGDVNIWLDKADAALRGQPETPGPEVPMNDTDALEAAWGIIANAGGGDWTKETPEWQEAAARWRDRVMPDLSARLAGQPETPGGRYTSYDESFEPPEMDGDA